MTKPTPTPQQSAMRRAFAAAKRIPNAPDPQQPGVYVTISEVPCAC